MHHTFDTSDEIIKEWTNCTTFNELDISNSRHVRDVNIGFNEVQQKAYDGASYFEKSTPFVVALLEKINADLAITLDLPVAPCVIGTEQPQPSMISLGLYCHTMSVVQGVYKDLNFHNDDEHKLYNFGRGERFLVLDVMKNQVENDLHAKLRPYRLILSEMLPFLLWARIGDPNLSNVIDHTSLITQRDDSSARTTGYFIDLESEAYLLDKNFFTNADWDPKEITKGDLDHILREWLASGLPIEEIFDAEAVWNTVRNIEALPDSAILEKIKGMSRVVQDYKYLDETNGSAAEQKKEEIIKNLADLGDMFIARRAQLADFIRAYIPEPTSLARMPLQPSLVHQ